MDQAKIDAIHEARARAYDRGRPEAVVRVHATGHKTARERVAELLDRGSAIEFGVVQGKADWGWAHTLGGVDFIGTVNGHPVVTSSTDYSDHGGGYGSGNLHPSLGPILHNADRRSSSTARAACAMRFRARRRMRSTRPT